MIRAVLFDLDGTLLNRDASVKRFVENQYERLQHVIGHIPKERYIKRFIELDNCGYVWKDKVYQQLIQEFNITGMTWEDMLQDYVYHFKENCVPFPQLQSVLANLKDKGLLLGMITNGKGQFQMDNIKALGIENFFDTILISDWVGMKKPDAQIFNKALETLEVLPVETIFVGDHPEKDVKAARNVGIKAIWKRNNSWNDVEADVIIDELTEIPSILQET